MKQKEEKKAQVLRGSSGSWGSSGLSELSVFVVTEISETEHQVSAKSQLFSTRGPQGQPYLKETTYIKRTTTFITNVILFISSIVVNE